MPRGRLIFPFLVGLRQLDTAATAADPDGAGELTSGYDETFREPERVLSAPADQIGESARVEAALIQFPAQIEPAQFERLEMMISGDAPNSRFAIVTHFQELERLGMINATTGRPTIQKGDRLESISNIRTGALIESIPNPPGLFVVQVQSRGFGLGPDRNLCLIAFEDREQSTRSS